MSSRYSILFAQIRPEVQERVSIGLLLVGSENVFFNFSKNKLSAVKELMSESAFRMLKDSLRNIEKTAIAENQIAGRIGIQRPISDEFIFNTFSDEYLLYLSKYNNNILSFSAPKSIKVEATPDVYTSLYRSFVEDIISDINPIVEPSDFDYIPKYKDRFVNHFNIKKEITSSNIPELMAPVKLDLIGINEITVFAQGIDLDRYMNHIDADLSQILLIDKAYSNRKMKSKGFIISKEPKNGITQHNIWKHFRESKEFEYVDISDIDKILEYATQHAVKPLFEENSLPKK